MMVVRSPRYHFSRAQVGLSTLFIAVHMTYFTMAPRVLHIFGFYEPGGILVFPLTFLLSDVITEVYSYRYSRFLIWCVIVCLGVFTAFTWLSMRMPTAWLSYGYTSVFNLYPRLYFGVAVATALGFFVNNYLIAKLKIKMSGRRFWLRSIISTSVGHAIFSATWVVIFHWQDLSSLLLIRLIGCMYVWKMTFEVLATPLASILSSWLKGLEGDIYDTNTNFNPFAIVNI